MIRVQEEIEVWGTIVFVDATSAHLSEKSLRTAIDDVRIFTHHVDEVFSTYKPDSVVSKLRRDDMKIEDCSPEVIEVWNACAHAQYLSTYERGAHINDPYTGMIAIGAESATVVGPDGGLTDALATALMVSGQDGAVWFSQPELADYSAWVINRNEKTSWALGPAITN